MPSSGIVASNNNNKHSSCPVCTNPFALPPISNNNSNNSDKNKNRTPKHLRCGHTICLSCLQEHCMTDDRRAVICLKCTKRTYLEGGNNSSIPDNNNDHESSSTITSTVDALTPDNGLITNYRFLMAEHTSMSATNATSSAFIKNSSSGKTNLVNTNKRSNDTDGNNNNNGKNNNNSGGDISSHDEDETEEDEEIDDGLEFLADCESPGCEEKATGRCEGCGGAAFCKECFDSHLKHLPVAVREKHNFGSVADSQLCPKHKLPRQLFCMSHKKAVCATCATLNHRGCRDLRELTSVVETLRPRIMERQAKMLELFKAALTSCYELKNEMKQVDVEAEKTIAQLLENAHQCVRASLESAFQVQASAIQRKLELDQAFRTLSVEAGSFAEEVEEIKVLFDESQNKNPDPVKVARHAPAERPTLHTIIPKGSVVKSELLFDIKQDNKQFWQRRGAAVIPPAMRKKSQQEIDEEAEEFVRNSFSSTSANSLPRNLLSSSSTIKDKKTAEMLLMKTMVTKVDSRFGKSQGTSKTSFNHPKAISTLPNGNIAVCDMNNHRIQIMNPTAVASSSSNSNSNNNSSSNNKARRKRDQQIGTFVTFIPLRVPPRSGAGTGSSVDHLLHPAFPQFMCTLPNGNLFVLDNENRCGYFVDAMEKYEQKKSNNNNNDDDSCVVVNWSYPSAWVKPCGICVLPGSEEIAIIDEARHLISILDPSAQKIVREFDGVDMVYHEDQNMIGSVLQQHSPHHHQQHLFTSKNGDSPNSSHHQNQQHQMIQEDMIHRIDAPKAICSIPVSCPWGENIFDTLFDDDRSFLEAIDQMKKNHHVPNRSSTSSNQQQRGNRSSSSSSSKASPARYQGDYENNYHHQRSNNNNSNQKSSASSSYGKNFIRGGGDEEERGTHSHHDSSLPEEEEIRLIRKRLRNEGQTEVVAEIGDNNETRYVHYRKEKKDQQHPLIAVCSETFVSILDAQTGAFIRFIGGDASSRRTISRPWGICASEDGKRIAIVDGAQACLYVANVRDGQIILRIAHQSAEQLILNNKANLLSSGSSVGTGAGGGDGNNDISSSSRPQSISSSTHQILPSNRASAAGKGSTTSSSAVLTANSLQQLQQKQQQHHQKGMDNNSHQQHGSPNSRLIAHHLQSRNSSSGGTDISFYPQHIAFVPANGKLVVTDIVSHSVNVLDAVI